MVAAAELPIDTSASAMDMANSMFGDGMQITSASYSGDDLSSGIYSNGDAVAPGTTPSDTGVILSTGHAQDYTNSSGDSNQFTDTSSNTSGVDGDADLNTIAGLSTYDGAIFEAEFIPDGGTLTMQFVFSSEEYLEYVNAGFNDAVGVWVNGVKAELTIGSGEVSIDEINDVANQNLFLDNAGDAYNTEMDGLTITLTIKAPVNPGVANTIKIGIADAGDSAYDSNLLIAGDSIQSLAIAIDDSATVVANSSTDIDVLDNDTGVTLHVTHINGIAVSVGDSVTLATGEVITLNPDGTLSAQADGDVGSNTFTYSVEDGDGNTDVAIVTLETTIPCFVAGARISTDQGHRAIETLSVGDRIETRRGFKRLRWIGSRHASGTGNHAPVIFEKDTIGIHSKLMLSQQHRVLLTGAHAAIMFDSDAVLVRAKDLINGKTIRLQTNNQPVEYFHLLFDQHQVVLADGLWSESFHPGEEVMTSMDETTKSELLELFPELDPETGRGYGEECFPSLRGFEARAFLQEMQQPSK